MTMNPVTEQLALSAQMTLEGDDLQISYEVRNDSDEAIVLVNFVQRPVAEPEQDPDRVAVETAPDGTLLITQSALEGEQASSVPPLHRAVLVEAGATHAGAIAVSLPETPSRAQLRLGWVPASALSEAKLAQLQDGTGALRVLSAQAREQQRLLSSEVVELG